MKGASWSNKRLLGIVVATFLVAFAIGRFSASAREQQIERADCPPCLCQNSPLRHFADAKDVKLEAVGAAGPEQTTAPVGQVVASKADVSVSSRKVGPNDSLATILEKVAINKWVMIAESNTGFHNMTVSFLAHLQRAKPEVTNYIVFALDSKEYQTLKQMGVPTVFDNKEMHDQAAVFRQTGYDDIVYKKLHILLETLKLGYHALLSDVDVVWLRNPFLYIETLPECSLYFYCDTEPTSVPRCTELNTGMFFVRSSPQTIALVEQVINAPRAGHDQDTFNSVLRRYANSVADPLLGECSRFGDITYQHLSLPEFLFGGFRRFFGGPAERGFPKKKLIDYSFQQPFGIHFNWLGEYKVKRAEMVELKLWREDFKMK